MHQTASSQWLTKGDYATPLYQSTAKLLDELNIQHVKSPKIMKLINLPTVIVKLNQLLILIFKLLTVIWVGGGNFTRHWVKLRWGYFQFPDFRSTFCKENYHNSTTNNDVDMKLGPVPKLDKTNKITSKSFDDDVISTNCDVIVVFPIYSQFGTIQKPDSIGIACKTYIFIKSNLLSYKNWKQN